MAHSTVDFASGAELPRDGGANAGPVPTHSDTRVRMLRLSQVLERTGLGKTTIYELQKLGRFPHSVSLTSSCVRWIESEIDDWLTRQAATRVSLPRR